MLRKRITQIILLVAVSMLTFQTRALADEVKSDTVKVGFFAFDGYHDIDENGVRSGYGYDFLNLMRRYTNVVFEYVGYDKSWVEIQDMLERGEVDMVTSVHKSNQRLKRFDFSNPIGTNCIKLNVKADDNRFTVGDCSTYEGMTIGCLEGSSTINRVTAFARSQGFSFRSKFYPSAKALKKALENEEIDAIAATSLRKTEGEKTLSEFDTENFYAIVKKGNRQLLNTINSAISQMDRHEGNWEADLYQKNYLGSESNVLYFSEREREYIAAHSEGGKKLVVAFDNEWAPFAYKEQDRYIGILPEYFEMLMQMTGMQYDVYDSSDPVIDENAVLEGKIDVYMGYAYDPYMNEEKGFIETAPFMNAGASILRLKGTETVKTIGLSSLNPRLNQKIILEKGQKTIEFRNSSEVLNALRLGEIDEAFLYTIDGEYLGNKDKTGMLFFQMVPYTNVPLCAIAPNSGDHTLISILTKCMKNIPADDLNAIVAKNITYSVNTTTVKDLFSMHPLVSTILLAVVMMIIGAFLYNRSKHLAFMKYSKELEEKVDQISVLNNKQNENLDIISNAGYGIWAIYKTPEGDKAMRMNDTLLKIFGFEGTKLDPVNLYKAYHSRLLENVLEIENRDYMFMQEGTLMTRNLKWNHPAKGVIILNAGGKRYIQSDGEVIISGFCGDITEQITEQQRSNLVIESLAHSYDYMNYITLEDGSYITLSSSLRFVPEFKRIVDQNNAHLTASFYCDNYVDPAFRNEMKNFTDLSTMNQRIKKRRALVNQYKTVSGIWYEWTYIVADRNTDGTVKHVICAVRRIEDEKQAEIRKQRILKDNIAANKAKTMFLQNMSHEIRTPLNAMFGFAQLLGLPDGAWSDEEKDQYNKYIYNSYNMLDMLIGDILDIADSEHGNYRVSISDVNVNSVCNSALMSVEFRKPAEVKMYFTSEVPDDYTIQSDSRRIQQVLTNYLTNACKHTRQGEIHLHCSKTEHPGKLSFSVTDTGEGVPPKMAKIIFNRFTKLNQFVQGSGLGLNICQTVADKLGGEVYLDKNYTEGARFVFVLDDNNKTETVS